MIDWKKINTVLLDMDGTLLDLNFDNHFWTEFVPLNYAVKHNISIIEAKKLLEPRFISMKGKLEWYCLDYWSNALELNIAQLKQEISGLIAVLPHVLDFLEKLHNSTQKVYLVTDAHPDSLALKMEKTCLQLLFDGIISSHDLGLPKEHPEFWALLQQHTPFDKGTSLLVDDSLAVLRSAKQYGVAHLVSVIKPDSQQSKRVIDEFMAIEDFRELMLGL